MPPAFVEFPADPSWSKTPVDISRFPDRCIPAVPSSALSNRRGSINPAYTGARGALAIHPCKSALHIPPLCRTARRIAPQGRTVCGERDCNLAVNSRQLQRRSTPVLGELLHASTATLNQNDQHNDGQNAGNDLNSGSAHDESPFCLRQFSKSVATQQRRGVRRQWPNSPPGTWGNEAALT